MDSGYLNRKRMGTTLLPWQQNFFDNQMYFILDHPYAKLQSNLTCYQVRNKSLKFSQNWLFNHMTSQILLKAQVFAPQIKLIWPSLNLYNSGTRRNTEKR